MICVITSKIYYHRNAVCTATINSTFRQLFSPQSVKSEFQKHWFPSYLFWNLRMPL